ncbi:uncharacterized protein LOC103506691 [Diaphorina citri]|uniref:NADH dehydrogenase [ubiquinone] 1 alpha subcomplex subunit 11 n=1 Tax=Diaphorina citri TaxID=121845 RepID=A0A1S3CWM4_DIACI|nr:uncharacterized protein LOC103506691 [Diaphorina citri]
MSGFVRNLFGPYQIYDTPDHEDLIPKLLFVEKWTVYFSGSIAAVNYIMQRPRPKGSVQIFRHVFKHVGPAVATSAFFVGTLFASSHLRGKKDDEWNSFNATLASGALLHHIIGGPWTFVNYTLFVGLCTNLFKQSAINNWTMIDQEALKNAQAPAPLTGPYFFDWSVRKEYPPKWVNADDLEKNKTNQ